MSVVKRCPNCGTTQSAAGECKTCREARVQYFCTNHEPGIWVDGPTCPQCAARARSTPPTRSTATPLAVPARPRSTVVVADAAAFGDEPERASPRDDAALDIRRSRPALWKLLASAVLARKAPVSTAAPARDRAAVGHARGWLMQLVLRLGVIALVFVIGLVVALYVVVRALE